MSPARSKSQYKFFKFLEAHPDEAKARGITEKTVKEYTEMSKPRWKKLKEKIGKKNGKR